MARKQQNLTAGGRLSTTVNKPRRIASELAKQTLISLVMFLVLISSSEFQSGDDVKNSKGRQRLHVNAISFQPKQVGASSPMLGGSNQQSQVVASGVVNGGRPGKQLGSGNNGASGGATSLEPTIPPQLSSREVEKAIVDRILGDGYDKRIRPAGSAPFNASKPGTDGPTIVRVNTLVRSISKIDDVTMEYSVQLSLRQEWTDDRLAFGTMRQYKDYGLNSITLTEQERIWKPDLFFRNEKEGHFHKIIMPNVLLRIRPEGQVLYSIRISLVLACPMDLKYYPLDKQNCTIEMASYGYLDEDLKFTWKEVNPVQMAKPLYLPRFTLENFETAYCTSRTTTGAYSCLRIDLIFKREFSYYLIQIYIPCCMLVIVSWVSFWLDPNAIPARVSLGVTTLLTMATQISGINASLPPVSYTKAIDVWTGVCLTFVFGALLEFALVNYASRSDQHKREMLNSALTQTQQMRWREATAAAAAAGVAPPTSPPPDENSPSHLASKHAQSMFFGPAAFGPLAAAGTLGPMGAITGPYHAHHAPVATTVPPQYMAKPNGVQTLPNLNVGKTRRGGGGGGVEGIAILGGKRAGQQLANSTMTNQIGAGLGGHHLQHPIQTTAATNNNNNGVPTQTQMNNNCQQHPGQLAAAAAAKMTPPQINRALQYLRNPREVLMEAPAGPPKRKNWCKMWLAKFPTRSKRIDVISRIFFPLKFALFNLVYWTTYLFREEDTTQ